MKPPTFDDLMRVNREPGYAEWALNRWGADALMQPAIFDCESNDRVGLGDVVKKLTSLLGFETCSECEARRRRLNRWSFRRLRRPEPVRPCNCGGTDA